MSFKLCFVILLFFINTLFAFTIRDISDSIPFSNPALLQYIQDHIEPYFRQTVSSWDFSVKKEAVRDDIYRLLSEVEKAENHSYQPEIILLRSLLWHYLYQLKVDNAFKKADSLLQMVIKSNPENSEAAWLRGLHLVNGCRIHEGFRVLDSIRVCNAVTSLEFLNDFKEISTPLFLPISIDTDSSKIYYSTLSNDKYSIKESELIPQKTKWRVVEQVNPRDKIPIFEFESVYLLKPEMRIIYPEILPLKLDLTIDKLHMQKVMLPLLFEIDKELCETHMEIVADPSSRKEPLDDYLRKVIGKRFDVIRVSGELAPLNGISIRCYKRSIYRDLPGEFNALAVFDLHLKKSIKGHSSCKENMGDKNEPLIVRYLISVNSSSDVENKAELIFKRIINQFRNWQ